MEEKKFIVDFDKHIRALISVENNEFKILKVRGGWGNEIPLNLIKIDPVGETDVSK